MSVATHTTWVYLAPKRGSTYRQLFIKGRNIAARTLYGLYVSEEEPRSLEQIATDFDLPVEAVREAIAYCQSEPPEILEDWEREESASISRAGNASVPRPENSAPKV